MDVGDDLATDRDRISLGCVNLSIQSANSRAKTLFKAIEKISIIATIMQSYIMLVLHSFIENEILR
jgi:hypothetical protein